MLLLMLVLCLGLAAFVWKRDRRQRHEELIRQVGATGSFVTYDYEYDVADDGKHQLDRGQSPYPEWLIDLLGIELLHSPRGLHARMNPSEPSDATDDRLLQNILTNGPQWWRLELSSRKLQSADLELLSHQQELGELRLRRVVLPDQDLRAIGQLSTLWSLRFEEAALQQCDLAALANLTNLQQLELVRCDLSNAQLASLPRLERLDWLEIDGVSRGDVDLEWLTKFPNLERLWLVDVELSDDDLVHLQGLSKLKLLRLSGTRFSGRLPAGARLPMSIEFVSVIDSPVEECAWISDLPNLTSISLGDHPLLDGELRDVQWPPKLEELWLVGQSVDAATLDKLAGLPLRNLALSQDKVDPVLIKQFQAKCPDCRVALE